MARRSKLAFVLLVVLFVAVSCYALAVQPEPVVVPEAFPVGLLAGAWLLTPRSAWPWLTVATAGAVAGIYAVFDRPPVVAVGWGVSAALGMWVAVSVLTARGTQRAALMRDADLRRFVAAGAAGAAVGAVGTSITAALTGYAPWWVAAIGVGTAHLATYLVLLPHFMGRPRFHGLAPRGERIVQWTLTIVATVVVFLPINQWPSLTFVVIPFLGWAALRAPMRETLVQLLAVATLTHAMTSRAMGPFAVGEGTSAVRADLLSSSYALYVCALALTTIPFAMAVGVQRRQYWQARQEQARMQQLVQSAAGIAIIGTDSVGHIDLFNPGAESLLGYCADEVIGLRPTVFLTKAEIERVARTLRCEATFVAVAFRLADDDVESLDVEFVRKDGEVLTLQLSMSRVYSGDGRVLGYVCTGEDVTSRVNRERALHKALAHERVAVENLQELDQVKDSFVSGVSHELRTPITSILGYLEMLEDGGFGELSDEQVRALARVKGNSNRLLTLIDDLLMLSRIQEGSSDVEDDTLDLREIVEDAHHEMAPALLAAGIDFKLVLPEEPVVVNGDGERLGRVVVNLLGNAAKFTDRMGKVVLEVASEGETGVVSVQDSGIGIPDDEQPQLFNRFFRAASARERAIQGSGLGLSIARTLVQSHGGRIELDSEVGVGSTFRVRLPLEGAPSVPEQDRLRAREAARVDQDTEPDDMGPTVDQESPALSNASGL